MITRFSRDALTADPQARREAPRRLARPAPVAKAEMPIAFDLVAALAAAIALTVTIFGLLTH